jgi:hypothetical protein
MWQGGANSGNSYDQVFKEGAEEIRLLEQIITLMVHVQYSTLQHLGRHQCLLKESYVTSCCTIFC